MAPEKFKNDIFQLSKFLKNLNKFFRSERRLNGKKFLYLFLELSLLLIGVYKSDVPVHWFRKDVYWNWSDFFVSGLGLGFYFKLLRFFLDFNLLFIILII